MCGNHCTGTETRDHLSMRSMSGEEAAAEAAEVVIRVKVQGQGPGMPEDEPGMPEAQAI